MNDKLKELKLKFKEYFKTGDFVLFGDEEPKQIEVVPTGIISLDKALGVDGIPRGRILEIFGVENGGKTSLALYAIAAFQKAGGVAAYIDVEHTLSLPLAQTYGVNIEELLFSQPMSSEESLTKIEELTRSGLVSVIVIDSVAALVPAVEVDGEYSESNMGVAARLLSKAMRRLNPLLSKTGTTLIFINQIRNKIGVVYGSNETTPGGLALKFYSTMRLEVRKGDSIKNGNTVIGHHMKVKVVKNKVAIPFKTAEIPLYYGLGIDRIADVLDYAILVGVIQQSGSRYDFKGEKIHSGRDRCIEKLASTPDLLNKVIEEINNGTTKTKTLSQLSETDKEEDKE